MYEVSALLEIQRENKELGNERERFVVLFAVHWFSAIRASVTLQRSVVVDDVHE